jgi:nucleotide-binding universal stress UspA family protein
MYPEALDSGLALQQGTEVAELMHERVERELEAARASTGLDHVETVLMTGGARHELREAAEDLDMLVLGSHGDGRVAGVLRGSVSRRLAHSCPVPLAVVPVGVSEAGTDARS